MTHFNIVNVSYSRTSIANISCSRTELVLQMYHILELN